MEIKDSGARCEFETGAVRDIQDGKGRCDLLPLEQVAILIDSDGGDDVLNDLYQYQQTGDVDCIIQAIYDFCYVRGWTMPQAMLEESVHYEDGARKYGERNWEKGLPVSSYLNSTIRHYLKWVDGWNDEPHDRAVIWNLLCMWWTVENITD